MLLNYNQNKAVNADDPHVLVLAGPGTGKTKTTVERVVRLINEGVSGYNILLITFTNKAAREIRERISQKIDAKEVFKMTIGTFHGVALKMIKDHARLLGYAGNVSIYDGLDQEDILGLIIEENSLKISIKKALQALNLYYSGNPEFMKKWNVRKEDRLNTSSKDDDLFLLMNQYKIFIKENNAMDFGMILVEVNRLLTDFPKVAEYYRNLFRHVMIDEYQDTDYLQYSFHHLIKPENLFCVGDPNQSVYSFRGAAVDIILNFENKYPGAKVIFLDQNYRSTKQIVDASNNLISYNLKRFKGVQTTDRQGLPVQFCGDQDIPQLVRSIGDGKIAILSRGHAHLEGISEELTKAGIPHKRVGSENKLLKDKNVRRLIQFLRVLNNPSDNFSCRMIVNWPLQRVSKSEFAQIKYDMIENETYLIDELKLFDPDFFGCFDLFNMNYAVMVLLTRLGHLLKVSEDQYFIDLCKYVDDWENEKVHESSVENFLNHLSNRDMEGEQTAEQENEVTLMTIHASKGLEWPIVIVAGCEEGNIPPTRKNQDIEEERRLFYVAMTRPQDLLFLNWRKQAMPKWGNQIVMLQPSRFIKEIKG